MPSHHTRVSPDRRAKGELKLVFEGHLPGDRALFEE
jgi:hypothetical protein